jgi:tRNA U34 5-methylaminomethyl-2-thiouridine-forming methyltransferase MnmC
MVLIETADGSHSLRSEVFGETYHSTHGAIQESKHVFINAGLHWRAQGRQDLDVLEIGFGTGLNAFLTLLEAEKHPWKVAYVGIEPYPIAEKLAAELNYPSRLQATPQQNARFLEMHTCPMGEQKHFSNHFTFKKHEHMLDMRGAFDVVYFDAFAPDTQPELWQTDFLRPIYDALRAEGVFVTYCAKGSVRRCLIELGFKVEKLAGPPGKREMLRATKP